MKQRRNETISQTAISCVLPRFLFHFAVIHIPTTNNHLTRSDASTRQNLVFEKQEQGQGQYESLLFGVRGKTPYRAISESAANTASRCSVRPYLALW